MHLSVIFIIIFFALLSKRVLLDKQKLSVNIVFAESFISQCYALMRSYLLELPMEEMPSDAPQIVLGRRF